MSVLVLATYLATSLQPDPLRKASRFQTTLVKVCCCYCEGLQGATADAMDQNKGALATIDADPAWTSMSTVLPSYSLKRVT